MEKSKVMVPLKEEKVIVIRKKTPLVYKGPILQTVKQAIQVCKYALYTSWDVHREETSCSAAFLKSQGQL